MRLALTPRYEYIVLSGAFAALMKGKAMTTNTPTIKALVASYFSGEKAEATGVAKRVIAIYRLHTEHDLKANQIARAIFSVPEGEKLESRHTSPISHAMTAARVLALGSHTPTSATPEDVKLAMSASTGKVSSATLKSAEALPPFATVAEAVTFLTSATKKAKGTPSAHRNDGAERGKVAIAADGDNGVFVSIPLAEYSVSDLLTELARRVKDGEVGDASPKAYEAFHKAVTSRVVNPAKVKAVKTVKAAA